MRTGVNWGGERILRRANEKTKHGQRKSRCSASDKFFTVYNLFSGHIFLIHSTRSRWLHHHHGGQNFAGNLSGISREAHADETVSQNAGGQAL
ncbi:MAG TPA: hypothetical protein VK657_01265 [Terriglobales bacterium]|nr:hypothetical protein [Terriglobales bacterium]